MLHDSPVIVHTAIKVAIMSPATGLDPNAVPLLAVLVCVDLPGSLWEWTKFTDVGAASPGGAVVVAVVEVTAPTAVVG